MKPVYLAVLGTLALATGACVGTFDSGPPGQQPPPPSGADAGPTDPPPIEDEPTTARALFEANVAPIVTLNCATGGCHLSQDPVFGAADPTTGYEQIIGQRDRLFTGYLAEGSTLIANGNGHKAEAAFTSEDILAITAWLAQEKLDADAGGVVVATPLSLWSGCMDLARWQELDVNDLWANKNTNQGQCRACHSSGTDGFLAGNDDLLVFGFVSGAETLSPQFMTSYFTQDAAATGVVVNRARLEKVGNQIAPHNAHPAFDVDGNAMEALQIYYNETKIKMETPGACGLPIF